MREKRGYTTAAICGALTAVLIILIRFADVAPIGSQGTSVGLSRLNGFVFELFGVNILWYDITDWLGIAAILTAFLFASAGLIQLIKRKSLLKVDREILILGGLYTALIGLYILFENAVVNFRPIIMPDGVRPEASFPSSHTMIVCVIMGSTAILANKYFANKNLRAAVKAICFVIIAVTVIGRLISGVHWFTDIVGGILISISLLSLFREIIKQ